VLLHLTMLPATVALGCFLWLARRKRLTLPSMLAFLIGTMSVMIATLVFVKLPERVYAPILGFSVLFLALYFSPSKLGHFLAFSKGNKTRSPRLIAATFLIPVVLCGIYYRYTDIDTSQRCAFLKEEIRRLDPKKDDLYVVWASGLPFETVRPFDNLHDYFDNFNLVWIAAYNRCPFVVNRLKAWGVHDLFDQFDRKNVHLISTKATNARLMRTVLSACGKEPSFEDILGKSKALEDGCESPMQVFDVVYYPPEPLADNSPDCPVLKNSDLLLYPAKDIHVAMENTSVLKGKTQPDDATTFVIEHDKPKLVFRPNQAIDPNRFSHFGIQMAVSPWAFIERWVDLKFKLDNGKEKTEVVSVLPDGKMHSYAHKLDTFHFTNDSRIVQVEIRPHFKRKDKPENSFDIKCAGFTRIPETLVSSLRESPTK
jgi:hypothetical protein